MRYPDQIFEDLFIQVQMSDIFEDSKAFADAEPKASVETILKAYTDQKDKSDFHLKSFVLEYFDIPTSNPIPGSLDKPSVAISDHIHRLWSDLERSPQDTAKEGSSLLPLPYSYIVPGGRFNEIYYWDSYFTMLGLVESGRIDMVENMIDNFAHLILTYGHIPNGNRSYFLSRSQPPFFACMVNLLTEYRDEETILLKYHEALMGEYAFWMREEGDLSEIGDTHLRVVKLGSGEVLNRYYDEYPFPRQESYKEDIMLSNGITTYKSDLYTNIRAACESGWDFSSRWLKDPLNLSSIETTQIIPVDLNILLLGLESTLVKSLIYNKKDRLAAHYALRMNRRYLAIEKYCWDSEKGIYLDYNIGLKDRVNRPSLAMCFPLWAKHCNEEQATRIASYIEKHFLKDGGLTTTLQQTGHQWDAPNGWAPLQWVAVQGLCLYKKYDLAHEIARRWCDLNEKVYNNTGKMMEKYNVMDLSLPAGGGEYPVQDGFGWTNGVYLSLKKILE